MEIDDDDPLLDLRKEPIHSLEGAVQVADKGAPHDVDHGRLPDGDIAPAGHPRRVVERAQDGHLPV